MPKQPKRVFDVASIRELIVSADPLDGAIIGLEVTGEADIVLRIPVDVLVKLESLLANANVEQAKFHKIQ
jgi:hypothetical protein